LAAGPLSCLKAGRPCYLADALAGVAGFAYQVDLADTAAQVGNDRLVESAAGFAELDFRGAQLDERAAGAG
jgi:hypothetical protein